jgi:hypothetical protein
VQRTGTVFGDDVYERTVPDAHFLTAIALNLKRMANALTGINSEVEVMATALAPGYSAPLKRQEGRNNRGDCFQD